MTASNTKTDNDYPKISIVIPSYNQGRFIENTLKSILRQNYLGELEVIVADGGSTDETVDILKKYDECIIWFSEPDEGYTDALNKAFPKVTGDYVAIQSSDDYYLPDVFQIVADLAKAYPDAKIISGDNLMISSDITYMSPGSNTPKFITLEDLLRVNTLPQDATFFKASEIPRLLPLPLELDYIMDYCIWLVLLCQGFGISTGTFHSLYTVHDDQKSFGSPMKMAQALQKLPEWLMGIEGFPSQMKNLSILRSLVFRHESWWLAQAPDERCVSTRVEEYKSGFAPEWGAPDLHWMKNSDLKTIKSRIKHLCIKALELPFYFRNKRKQMIVDQAHAEVVKDFLAFVS